jgi:hypothetical protein
MHNDHARLCIMRYALWCNFSPPHSGTIPNVMHYENYALWAYALWESLLYVNWPMRCTLWKKTHSSSTNPLMGWLPYRWWVSVRKYIDPGSTFRNANWWGAILAVWCSLTYNSQATRPDRSFNTSLSRPCNYVYSRCYKNSTRSFLRHVTLAVVMSNVRLNTYWQL